jgi:hypothetical protein
MMNNNLKACIAQVERSSRCLVNSPSSKKTKMKYSDEELKAGWARIEGMQLTEVEAPKVTPIPLKSEQARAKLKDAEVKPENYSENIK